MTISASGWVRIGAVAFIAFVVLVSALSRHAPHQAPAVPGDPAAGAGDPLGPALRRCQALGEAGASDPECLQVWAESRRRFLSLGGSRP